MYLGTMLRETGSIPATRTLTDSLLPRYEALLGPLPIATEVDGELLA